MIGVRIFDYKKDKNEIEKIMQRGSADKKDIEHDVKAVIQKVRSDGDEAVSYFTAKFDGVSLSDFAVSEEERKDAYKALSERQIAAIKSAIEKIRNFAMAQKPKEFTLETSQGIRCGMMLRPIEKVGCYIPAGKYPLPSTAYMAIIPAKVAGVREIIVATPPQEGGKADPAIVVASDIAGATKIIKVGGVQAIAALAYGTLTIPKVDKIVGPGNIYVTNAKKLVFGDVGIDMLAGPSEILIIASGMADPKFIAADMLAQAEHDGMACAMLITDSLKFARDVKEELILQSAVLTTRETIEASFENGSCIVIVRTVADAIKLSNEIAPEHLEIVGYDSSILEMITNAGSIFFGGYSPESAGDYCSGTNHVLPTGQNARSRGGLSVYDFLKMITVQEITKEGLSGIKDTIKILAEMEGLSAHKNSALIRFENKQGEQN